MALSKKTLRAIAFPIVVLLLISFAGLVRAAVHYSCGNDGSFFSIAWYTGSDCGVTSGTPNFDSNSNDIQITDASSNASTLSIETTTTLGPDDAITVTTNGSTLNELTIQSTGSLVISGGALYVSGRLIVVESGNAATLKFGGGTLSFFTGAEVTNTNTNGLEVRYDNLPFNFTADSSVGQASNANVLVPAYSSADPIFSIDNIFFTQGTADDASFSIDSNAVITVNGDNDVDTDVAGTLDVVKANGAGFIRQRFAFNIQDDQAPVVESVTYGPTTNVLGVGDVITITVTFNEPITFLGSTDDAIQTALQLNNGASATLLTVPVNSLTASYEYVVAEGEDVAELEVNVAGLELGVDVSARDSTNNSAALNTLVFPSAGAAGSLSAFDSVAVDTTGPAISSRVPSHQNASVALDTGFSITFDEPVQAVEGGTIDIYTENDVLLESFNVGGIDVTVNGSQVTVDISSIVLTPGETYYVRMSAGAFVDALDNGSLELTEGQWTFTMVVPDLTPPSVVSLSPLDDAVEVPLDQVFTINFDEAVYVQSGAITLYRSDDVLIEDFGSGEFSVSGSQVTFDPTLVNNQSYYIRIAAGGVEDLEGNDFSGITNETTWSFHTPDTLAPVVSSTSPLDNAVDVSISTNIALTFNENIEQGTGYIEIRETDGDTIVQNISVSDVTQVSGWGSNALAINPFTDFEYGTEYYVLIDGPSITDAQGNTFAGIASPTTLSFTTENAPAPDGEGEAGGSGGGRSTPDKPKPTKPTITIDAIGSDEIQITGTHTPADENPTSVFGYSYSALNKKTKTVALLRNVDEGASFTETITELTCDTTYNVRVFAKNRSGSTVASASVTTDACDGSTEGTAVVEETTDAEVEAAIDEALETPTTEPSFIEVATRPLCTVFTMMTGPGESNSQVPLIKVFLNFLFPGLALDVTSPYFDEATVNAVKQFQTRYADTILAPLGLTTPTGWWYTSSIKQAHRLIGCTE